jgi:Glycosyl transferase family 2
MADAQLPTVSVLMPAYNYAEYVERAIQSALAQDYPPELLTVVVVDDGSTDATAAVVSSLVDRNPGRIVFIQQPNSGPSAAINRALSAATGDLVAVLDADDMWLPAKTRRQVELLGSDPNLGLVFCDMRVVDDQEGLVRPSQVGNIGVFPRRALAQLLCQNVVTQSSLMIRRSLTKPIPVEIPYSDWWFAICAAQTAELLYLPEPLALYREHGANLTSATSGVAGVREHRKEIRFQLWALRNLDLTSLTVGEVQMVWRGVEAHAARAMGSANSYFVELAEVTEADAARALGLAAEADLAAARQAVGAECLLLLQSLGWNPYDAAVHVRFLDATGRALQESVA